MEKKVDVAIIGAGSAGLFALSQVRRHTDNWVLINGGELGTTCARVGCMPSKVAIQIGDDLHRRNIFDREGIDGGDELSLDAEAAMEHVRDLRDVFVDKVLSNSTDHMGDELIEGQARFIEPDLLDVDGQKIRADRIIIATGSSPVIPQAWAELNEHLITTDELFELEQLPESMAVIGLGAIGMEMGQALRRMGVEVTGIDMAEHIAGISDPVINKVAVEVIGKEMPLWLGEAATLEASEDGRVSVSAGDRNAIVDKVLVSMGRAPNTRGLNLEVLGVSLDERGVPEHDPHTMQVGTLPVYIAGDVSGSRAILHEAGDEGRIAGYNCGQSTPVAFRRKPPFAITFSDPNIVAVGQSWRELDEDRIAIGEVRMGPVGRALIMGKNKGILRVYADNTDGRLLGAEMVCAKGENIGHLLAWAIQHELSVFDLLSLPFYHPTMEEALQGALYDARGKIRQQPQDPVELRRL